MHPVRFETMATDGAARVRRRPHRTRRYRTPCFMPVGTRGAIKYLSAADYERLGAEIVLGNTYHLMLRPGAETVAALGGLGRFAGWDGLTLTDSGGFQVFSLDPKVDDDGVTFKSTYDGSSHRFTPEIAVAHPGAARRRHPDGARRVPAAAVAARGHPARGRAHRRRGRRGPGRHTAPTTRRCSASCRVASSDGLRAESAQRTVALDFDGYGIGGLSVGETRGGDGAGAGRGARPSAGRPASLPDGRRRPGQPGRGRGARASTSSTASCRPGSAATAPR